MGEFDFLLIWTTIPKILTCFGITFLLTIATVLLSLIFGFLLAWQKLGKNRILRGLANGYTLVIRCTPTIILLFLCYYGLPKAFEPLGIQLDDMHQFWYCLITFTLLNMATVSELIRSTYLSINRGQFEAATMVGLTRWQTLRRIILPQGLYIALPNMGNMLISLMKETSLAFTIGLIDMMGKTKLLISLRYGNHALESYLSMLLIYWGITIAIERSEKVLEKKLGVGMNTVGKVDERR